MHAQSIRQNLSERDKRVLESLFTPFEIGGNIQAQFNFDVESEVKDGQEENTPEVKKSIQLEIKAIELAESGNLEAAISYFDQAIEIAPNRCSVYNNRAQALRLNGNNDGALKDLEKAINLSVDQHRTRCQALCQRGLLYRKIEDIENAKKDFEEAAKYGSRFAKTQLVEMNPYAALCNQMLQQAFQQLS